METSQLYLKDTYLNKDISIISNRRIVEYDLKSANTSLCKEYKLLSDDQISKIENMKKKERVITIGKLQRKDREFNSSFKESFKDIRRRFFYANNLEDKDILAIKKDAIFCLVGCNETKFGKCHFVEKNVYTSYMHIDKLELYYNARGESFDKSKLDVKGISDETIHLHDGFMLDFINTIFKKIEEGNEASLFRYINRFVSKYKHLQLPVGYYREFNNTSLIRLNDMDQTFEDETFIPFEHKQEHLNIDYNFFNVILPIVKIVMG